MLSISHVEDFLARIGFQDINFSIIDKDSFGDILVMFDPDTEYSKIRDAVQSNRAMRNKIVDSGLNYCELNDVIYIDGNKVSVAILCEQGIGNFGTNVKMMVKSVDYVLNGEVKSFLSFESLKNYLSRVTK